ncbi:hypothetical protein AK812_SmicGene22514 [Symbiodinium microadriaticum]|uniref:Uncharacterized protein n=1 Tax=Symbiodinium microadriaticum TaxID=2951 RepID=A0A1Q9DJK8_SYMMI|nr:hypothetical protein AK812_SmicGene22514 [Symbiodinium microadriaticum]CAE7248118.1 unnamed protein product [Symbiodinium sp. KB8]CAE7862402.1 unnamed protein product [Symbiodinium microadriaticum]
MSLSPEVLSDCDLRTALQTSLAGDLERPANDDPYLPFQDFPAETVAGCSCPLCMELSTMCQCNRCNNNRKCPAATDSKFCDFKFGKVRNYWQSQLQYYMQRIAHEQMDADSVEYSALLNDVQKRSQTEAEAYYKKKRDDREAARLKRKQPEVPKPRKVKQEVPNAAPPIKMEAPNQIVIPDANATSPRPKRQRRGRVPDNSMDDIPEFPGRDKINGKYCDFHKYYPENHLFLQGS